MRKRNTMEIDKLRHLSRKLVRELGILEFQQANSKNTIERCHALIEISKEPGITISKLGILLVMLPTSISRLVKILIKEGLVEIKPSPDRREKSLYLTIKGIVEVEKTNDFSHQKIEGALALLSSQDISEIIQSLEKYTQGLERNRTMKEQIKIITLSTSRPIRRQIVNMISVIQKEEFFLPVTENLNLCILKAEQEFYYNNSYNFWYATNTEGTPIGSIGLKKVNEKTGEIKKFFVTPPYRGKGVAQKLMQTLLKATIKHNWDYVCLGTVNSLKAAHRFYEKIGFVRIGEADLPKQFKKCHLDSVFFKGKVKDLKII